jgi:hypothetical protein
MGTRVRLTRSGGIAGLSMVASVDLDDLPAAKARKVRSALEGVDFEPDKRRRSARAAPIADGFQYDLEVDDGKKRSVTVRDPVASPALQTLLEVLLPLAEPE